MPQFFVETGRSTDYLPWCLGKTWPSPGGSTLLQKWKKSEFHNIKAWETSNEKVLQTFPKCCEGTHLVIMDCCGELRDPLQKQCKIYKSTKYLPILKFIMNTRGKHWENLKPFTQISHICFFSILPERWESGSEIHVPTWSLRVWKINLCEFYHFHTLRGKSPDQVLLNPTEATLERDI